MLQGIKTKPLAFQHKYFFVPVPEPCCAIGIDYGIDWKFNVIYGVQEM